MTALATAVTLILAGTLLRAAIEKVRDPAPAAATIRALGAPERVAAVAAIGLTLSELAVAVALLFRPDATLTKVGVVALASSFALAGLLALRRDEPIRCNCFGSGSGQLGKTQLLALGAWLAGIAVVHAGFVTAPPVATSAAWLASLSLILAVLRFAAVRKAWSEARDDRRSAQEMYAWLPSY